MNKSSNLTSNFSKGTLCDWLIVYFTEVKKRYMILMV